MSRRLEVIIIVLVALGALALGACAAPFFAYPTRVEIAAGEARSYLLTLNAPPGTMTTEENAAYQGTAVPRPDQTRR